MHNRFLVINGDYEYTELGLFENDQMIDSIHDDHSKTSSQLVPHIQTLLHRNTTSLNNLDFIAANTGPGPFTTLRVILATVNGISFALNKPLISIDSIKGLLNEHTNPQWPYTIALYNAFAQEIFFAIEKPDKPIQTGYENIEQLLSKLKETSNTTIRFIGKGAHMYIKNIKDALGDNAYVDESIKYCSLQQMGHQALQSWNSSTEPHYKLTPHYLKALHYKKHIT